VKASGIFLVAVRAGAWRYLKKEVYEETISSLPPEDLAILQKAGPNEWVDEEVVMRVLAVARKRFTPELWMAMLEAETERVLNAFFRTVISASGVGPTLSLVPMLWPRTHDTGSMEVALQQGKLAFVRYRGFVPFSSFEYRDVAVASFRVLLKLAGAKERIVTIVEQSDASRELVLRLEWG
jgi:hypothetical protein